MLEVPVRGTRPTSDRVREAVFSRLEHEGAVEVCRRNVRALGLTRVRVAQQAAERFVREAPSRPWDLVFLDPPYDVTASELVQVLAHIVEPGALSPDGTVVVERRARDAEPSWPDGLRLVVRKDYGETAVFYLEPSAPAEDGADASEPVRVPTGS